MILTPEQFGAIGDGVADDTAPLQSMFDAADAFGSVVVRRPKVLLTPGAKYRTTDELRARRTLMIDGQGALISSSVNDPTKAALRLGDETKGTYRWRIDNLDIGSVGASQSTGLYLESLRKSVFRGCYISGFNAQVRIACASQANPFSGWLDFIDCYFQGGAFGIDGSSAAANIIAYEGCQFLQHSQAGIAHDNATNVVVNRNDFSYCRRALDFTNAGTVAVTGNYTEKCGDLQEGNECELMTFTSCRNVTVTGNTLSGAYGIWKARKHMARGVVFRGCDHARVEHNALAYFMKAAVLFDEDCGPGCIERGNVYSEIKLGIGCKTVDLSGRAEIEGARLPVVYNANAVGNFNIAPNDIAGSWHHGNGITVEADATAGPYIDGSKGADRITFLPNGAAVEDISIQIIPVSAGRFALRFWAWLGDVQADPYCGLAMVQARVFRPGKMLLQQDFFPAPGGWRFFEFIVSDDMEDLHEITLLFRPSMILEMSFSWALSGVQYAPVDAPYVHT